MKVEKMKSPEKMKVLLILVQNVRKIAIKIFFVVWYFTSKLELVSNIL